jgi:membrane protein
MKVVSDLKTKLDRLQRHLPPLAVGVAVSKKFSDDQANQYVVSLGWYGFVSIYPLLLVVVTVFGFIGVPSLGHGIVSTLHQFPVVGPQFNPARPSSNLHGSVFGLVVGTLVLLYGAQGVTQSAQRAMAQVWGVDVHDLPGFAARLVRSLIGLAVIGATFVVNAFLATLATSPRSTVGISMLVIAAMLAINVFFYWAAFWVLTPSGVPVPAFLAGSAVGALGFTMLITVGSGLIRHQIRNSSATYGQFGIVIGLVGFLFLLAKISLYGAELNPVLWRHLWPRSLGNEDVAARTNEDAAIGKTGEGDISAIRRPASGEGRSEMSPKAVP